MGLFSFMKRKRSAAAPAMSRSVMDDGQQVAATVTVPNSAPRRPSKLLKTGGAPSRLSTVFPPSSSMLPNSHPSSFSGAHARTRPSLSSVNGPIARTSRSHSQIDFSSHLDPPNAPYANDALQKKGSDSTLDSTTRATPARRRGAHDPPRINPELAALGSPRPTIYGGHHPSRLSGAWLNSWPPSGGYTTDPRHSTVRVFDTERSHSTGSSVMMNGDPYYSGEINLSHSDRIAY